MSYEVLARRLRPTTFDDVVGQQHVTTTLRNALLSDRLPHALLLCGPRGVGKTSIARILARSLNCDRGPTDQPCGSCHACSDISSGTSMDVQEIDAASHTGVENVREIRESIRFSAAPGKHRIFIIDEVHMLSQAAFNALLKTLEEPPPRSLFIFATTDPQKMPVTVLSRVQRFDLSRIPAAELLDSLKAIAASEELEIPESVLRALIREGEGSFRDVLTLLDRLISGLGPCIDEARATEVLGWIDRAHTRGVVDATLAQDAAAALQALEGALEQGAEPARLAADMLEEFRDLLVARLIPDPSQLIDAPPEEIEALVQRAAPHSAETLQRCFRVLLSRISELSYAPRPAHALEVAVVRLATLPSTESLQALIERLDALERGAPPPDASSGGPSSGSRGTSSSERSLPRRRTAPVARAEAAPAAATAGSESSARSAPSPADQTPPTASTETARDRSPDPKPASTQTERRAAAGESQPRANAAATSSRAEPQSRATAAELDSEKSPAEPEDFAHEMDALRSAGPARGANDPSGAEPSRPRGPQEADDSEAFAAELRPPPPERTSGERVGRERVDGESKRAARVDPEVLRSLRIEAKTDPAVLRVIEALDAEIRDIRFTGRSPT